MDIIKSLSFFFLAGLCEIGGGYLVWLWLKEEKPLWYGLLGGIILAMYGVVATWQTASFGRVYSAYGGIFIVMALIWAWKVDNFKPDRYDIMGALIALLGLYYHVHAQKITVGQTIFNTIFFYQSSAKTRAELIYAYTRRLINAT